MSPHILVVEDDASISTGLALNLRLEGYTSSVVAEGDKVAGAVDAERPDLVLLDLSLPRVDGLEVLSRLRGAGNRTPIIVLSAREGEHDKVAALRLGADDYVTKPFALAELMARVAAVLRRAAPPPPEPDQPPASDLPLVFEEISIAVPTRTVTRRGAEVRLTHLEFELLLYFVRHPAQVLSRARLLREVWGLKAGGSPRTVDNFVAQLRSKLEEDPDHPRHLLTVRGSGYVWRSA
ncbi:MAG TPA: response regulator transcription factor [Kofleriaceae bacterium]|nr:response regulator transcription factor [Kofleriaceae bacterium]